MSNDRSQLWYVYDAGFRWGKPDFAFPLGCAYPVTANTTREGKYIIKNGPCVTPGCFVCYPRTEQEPQ